MASAQVNGTPKSHLAEANKPEKFTWLKPHPVFAVILVGSDTVPYGIHKDLLCAKSGYFRRLFAEPGGENSIEHLVQLPNFSSEVFALCQHYLYRDEVVSDDGLPSYEELIGLWKLGIELEVQGLCDKTLEAMNDVKEQSHRIPAPSLIVQVWKDTPDGSKLRELLLTWAAEYVRVSDERSEFVKLLPREVLTDLVVTMSSLESPPLAHATTPQASEPNSNGRKIVHYLDPDADEEETARIVKKHRRSSGGPGAQSAQSSRKSNGAATPKTSSQPRKPSSSSTGAQPKRRSIAVPVGDAAFPPEQKLNFCADLLHRMLSGPGFWTRLVKPFKQAVDPVADGVPDYLEKVTSPMDLGTVKEKMNSGGYATAEEFVGDIRQIFSNCYTYWKEGDALYQDCQKFERTFEDKYSEMNKWLAKMSGVEQ